MRASPLHYAVLSGHRAIVRLLLENGANVSSKDYAGSTPEAWAYASRHLGFAKMLQAEAARLAPRPFATRQQERQQTRHGNGGVV